MGYRRLAREERYQIAVLIQSGQSIRAAGRRLNRSPSTIVRELARGKVSGSYDPGSAQAARERYLHRPLYHRRKIRGSLERYVRKRLYLDWSPEQISGRRRLLGLSPISHPTIYRYVEEDRANQGRLWKRLRVLRKKFKNRKIPGWKPRVHVQMPGRVPITERPKIVDKRLRLGDYERDTVLGRRGGSVLLTLVDRRSRLLKLACMPKSTCQGVHQATVSLLRNEPLHTITNDNGVEFRHHKKTAKCLKAQIYFSSSFRSWERGTNENTNGLLRQYFPKKQEIGSPTKAHVRAITRLINSRPRKCLGYRTPREVHSQLKSSAVALDP